MEETSGNVTRLVARPRRQSLFLQSLAEEEQNPSTSSGGNNSQKTVEDKDLVEYLENGVNFWADYSKVQYHPQSLYGLHGSWTDFDKFDNYGTAREVISEWSHIEEMNERLRFFVEECDHIQGIQCIVDDSGGFSSVAVQYLENIADDYTNTPVLLYCARDPVTHVSSRNQRESITRSLHDAILFSKLSSFCNLMVPIGLPSLSRSFLSPLLCTQDEKPFHSGAICAAAIHSVTVPFRLQNVGPASNLAHSCGNIDIVELVHIIYDQGRQNMVTALDVAMPATSLTDRNGLGNIQKNLHSLTPEISDEDEDPYSVESLVVHGALDAGSLYPHPFSIDLREQRSRRDPQQSFRRNPAEGFTRRRVDTDGGTPKIERCRLAFSLSLQRHGVAMGAVGSQVLRDRGFGKEEAEDMGGRAPIEDAPRVLSRDRADIGFRLDGPSCKFIARINSVLFYWNPVVELVEGWFG